jgi:hypothetical protein
VKLLKAHSYFIALLQYSKNAALAKTVAVVNPVSRANLK